MLKNKTAREPSEHPGESPPGARAGEGPLPHFGQQGCGGPPSGQPSLWAKQQLLRPGPVGWPTVLGRGIRMAFDFSLSNFSSFNFFYFSQRETVYLGQHENREKLS